ncbi:MAG: hypothetical protein RBU30_07705 [Polyangia bacterium]|jgi:hypothetical protein|nr:hypothetical protein [Polyangia bacterium]
MRAFILSMVAALVAFFQGACSFDRSGLEAPSECGVCDPGLERCQANLLMICDPCGAWVLSEDCGALGQWCVETAGTVSCSVQNCQDPCSPEGALRCRDDHGGLELCAPDNDGCLAWAAGADCGAQEQCVETTADASAYCAACDLCALGDTRCAAGMAAILERCELTGLASCTSWAEEDCGWGYLCQEPDPNDPASCQSCVECAEAPAVCSADGQAIELCQLDQTSGCRHMESFACEEGFSCAPGTETGLCGQDGSTGITGPGSTDYPAITVGNPSTGSGPVSASYLVADRYTTTVPLTAVRLHSWGIAAGNVKISIYDHDVANDLPGQRLFPEVTASLTANAWTTINIPTKDFLPAGDYWILFNVSANNSISYSSQTGGIRVWRSSPYSSGLPQTAGSSGWTRVTTMDCTYFSGVSVQGYAKATRVTLGEGPVQAREVSLYAHEPGGFRLAIYGDNAGPATRLWESGAVQALASTWNNVEISSGTPSLLNLGAGTFWLVWQWDSPSLGPGFQTGAAGEGRAIELPFGGFPAAWPGGSTSDETWSLHLIYTRFQPPLHRRWALGADRRWAPGGPVA